MSWAPAYTTLAALDGYLRIPTGDTTDDAILNAAIEDASRSIDQFCSRQFGQVAAPAVRYYTPKWWCRRQAFVVEIDDLMVSSGVVVQIDTNNDLTFSTTLTSGTSRLLPYNAAGDNRPWTSIQLPSSLQGALAEGSVMITATWGWSAVPTTVSDACLLQAARFVKRRESPFGIAGSPEMGSEFRLSRWLDPDVQVMLRPYVRFWVCAA